MHQILQEKKFYEQYFLFDLDLFSFLITFCARNSIHYDQKLVAFRLIIKYFSSFLTQNKFN